MTVGEARDTETRDRLLAAATRLFAERGFAKVTVRDISERAVANVAAVNYHFGGKVGLYEQVLRSAIAIMQTTTEQARQAGTGLPPADQVRAYVRVFIQRVVRVDRKSWIHQLMMHELSDPTPGLDLVIEQVIKPRMQYLGGIIAQLLECSADDPRVGLCAMSIHAQCMTLMNARIGERIDPAFRATPHQLERFTDHIVMFSLGGIGAVKTRDSGFGIRDS